MNLRRAFWSVLAVICLIGFTNCGSSSTKTVVKVVAIAATSGTPQSATVGAAFAAPLVATVTTGGTPTSGVTVTFAAPGSGASGTFAGGATTAVTNSSGVATSAVFTANTKAGAYTVTASAPGATTSASFSLTNKAGAAATITATSGTPQSATVSAAFAAPLVATVVDSDSNPVNGASVTFTAPAAGASGTFANSTATETDTTNASGVATSSTFTANATVGGPYNVAATVPGVAAPANFILTNTAAVETITATSGTPQSATVSTAFAAPLVATVKTGASPDSGVVVTFTAPASGASGTFADSGTNVTVATTNASGVATSAVFTANATAGGPYNVVATAPGAAAPANFSLTNTAVVAGATNYSFYVSGLESINGGPNFYAIAGAVAINANGTVAGGEQDYNDAFGLTSPEPAGDSITGGTLTVSSTTGQGTLTLVTNNSALGVGGTETFGVQFVNTNHALVIQFDGTATSSGSMDVQSAPATPTGKYAFSYSGVDPSYNPTASGGVFSVSSGAVSGVFDQNDSGTITKNTAFAGTFSAPDALGRGTLTITGGNVLINYYAVGPEVARFIAVSATQSFVGSAFGQGTGTFSNASLPSPAVFGVESNSWGFSYAGAGMFSVPASGTFQGIADDDEQGAIAGDASISGIYSITSNGYGSLTVNAGNLGSISALGVYMTDPNLNLSDPNNTSTGLGGALVLDLDPALASGSGVLVPQTDTSTSAFTGKYAFGAQDFNGHTFWEFDYLGQGSVAAGALTGSGLVSDPGAFFTAKATDSGVTFSGTPLADGAHAGRYSMLSTNAPANPFVVTVSGTKFGENVILYQASGGQLFWVEEDSFGTFLGSLEQQGSLTGLPAARTGTGKAKSTSGQ